MFRVGRQWLIYGFQRLISNRYGPNVPLPFDGFRAVLKAAPWNVDAFAVKPVETNPGVFESSSASNLFSLARHFLESDLVGTDIAEAKGQDW